MSILRFLFSKSWLFETFPQFDKKQTFCPPIWTRVVASRFPIHWIDFFIVSGQKGTSLFHVQSIAGSNLGTFH